MGLQLCVCRCGVGWSPQLFDFFLVERQLDLSSVTARLRVREFVTRGRGLTSSRCALVLAQLWLSCS
ncbi:hypothetical protein Taro_013793, partial [Colocasia esculenta]|nr:hypothetical protein [Colocasia esculenta]